MIGDKMVVGGEECEWDGFCLVLMAGMSAIPLPNEPSVAEIEWIVKGWKEGVRTGKTWAVRSFRTNSEI